MKGEDRGQRQYARGRDFKTPSWECRVAISNENYNPKQFPKEKPCEELPVVLRYGGQENKYLNI